MRQMSSIARQVSPSCNSSVRQPLESSPGRSTKQQDNNKGHDLIRDLFSAYNMKSFIMMFTGAKIRKISLWLTNFTIIFAKYSLKALFLCFCTSFC